MDESTLERLLNAATEAIGRSYAPYSAYSVGAAVLADNGEIYRGANIENSSYGATMCAERVAVFKAISEGARKILAIAVRANDETLPIPCGMCLQVLSEFAEDIPVIVAGEKEVKCFSLFELLPYRFGEE